MARSSVEAQYRSMAYITSKLTQLQHFLQQIGFPSQRLIYYVIMKLLLISHLIQCSIKEPNILESIVISSVQQYSVETCLHHLLNMDNNWLLFFAKSLCSNSSKIYKVKYILRKIHFAPLNYWGIDTLHPYLSISRH